MNLSLVRIQRFVAVAEHLSFTRAATLLGIDQPWLSRQIMQLEDQLGIVLFERNGAKITLTPEGKEFYEVAREIEIAAQRVHDKAMEMTRRTRSELTVCVAYSTFPIAGRHQLLDRFASIRPDVKVEISAEEWTADVVAKVMSGEADFGIAFGPLDEPGVEICDIEKLQLEVAVPRELALARKPSLQLGDFKDLSVAMTAKDPRLINKTPHYSWFYEYGAIPVHVPEGRRFVIDVAKEKRICALCYTAADQVPDDFVKLPITDAKLTLTLALIRTKRIMSPSAERLWRLAHEMAKSTKVS